MHKIASSRSRAGASVAFSFLAFAVAVLSTSMPVAAQTPSQKDSGRGYRPFKDPSPDKANVGEQVLYDPRVCWIEEIQDPNGGWGERLGWSWPQRGSQIDRDPEFGTAIHFGEHGWQIVKRGGEIYLEPRPDRPKSPGYAVLRYRKVPCPGGSDYSGGYVGVEILKNWGRVSSTEKTAATGVTTNQFSDSADPIGGGLLFGYRFTPFNNAIVVSPFASFDFMNSPVNHTFPGGSYLGTTANFMGTFGLKVGPQFGQGLWLYGIAGVSVMNETLKINFIPTYSSQSAWVAGGTVGLGGAWKPDFLQGYGRPVSLFAEYQHTWWQDANFNTPTASPFFNYTFARQDDVVKVGFTVDLSTSPPPASAPMYRKALPAK